MAAAAHAWAPDTAFLQGLDFFGAVVKVLEPADWTRPSPCAGWQARDVLGHVGVATRFGTALLREEEPQWKPVDPPGAAVDGDPAAWWSSLAEPARAAVQGVDLDRVVDSPMGQRSIGAGLSFPALDLFVHAWDLARCAGRDVEIPAEAIAFAHSVLDAVPEEQKRSERVFAAPAVAPPGASATQEFIAWTGRDPQWSPAP